METAEIKDHGAKARDSRALTEEEFMNVIDESGKKVLPRDRDLHKFCTSCVSFNSIPSGRSLG